MKLSLNVSVLSCWISDNSILMLEPFLVPIQTFFVLDKLQDELWKELL